MPVYNDVPPFDFYPRPEEKLRALHAGMVITSILDVGSGHGGVFDYGYWTARPGLTRRAACDYFRCRPTEGGWELHDGVDAHELVKKFGAKSFDVVQCMETLEHVRDSRRCLEQLVAVARKLVVITSADEMHHRGPEQEAFEKYNPACKYLGQPKVADMRAIGFDVRVEETVKRQLIAWKIMA